MECDDEILTSNGISVRNEFKNVENFKRRHFGLKSAKGELAE